MPNRGPDGWRSVVLRQRPARRGAQALAVSARRRRLLKCRRDTSLGRESTRGNVNTAARSAKLYLLLFHNSEMRNRYCGHRNEVSSVESAPAFQ
jgi:hypothetical protein